MPGCMPEGGREGGEGGQSRRCELWGKDAGCRQIRGRRKHAHLPVFIGVHGSSS